MYSTNNEGKTIAAERFIRALKNKDYKHMTSISKNMFFDISLLIQSRVHILTLTVCSFHVTYAFQSEFTLYSCLNVKELLARSRCEI